MPLPGVLSNPRFAWYTLANGLGYMAAWMYRLALGWTIWQLTHSAYWLGLLAICDLGPALVFGPLGGLWGDRAGAAKVIAWAQIGVFLTTLTTGAALWLGVPAPALLALALIGGCAVTTEDAARATIVTALAPEEQRSAAVALTAIVINLARFVGPALAGVLATLTDIVWIFPIAAAMGIPLALFGLLSRIPFEAPETRRHWLRELGEGLAYLRSNRAIGLILLNFTLASLLARPVYELVPGLAGGLFGQGIAGLSAMTTAVGVGAMGAGLVMLGNRNSKGAARASFIGALAAGVVVVVLAFMPFFGGAVAACAALGFAVSLGAISAQIFVQLEARAAMRNRVLAIWSLIIRVGPAGGALVIGAVADRFGFRWPLGLAGAAAVLAAAALWLVFRRQSAKAG